MIFTLNVGNEYISMAAFSGRKEGNKDGRSVPVFTAETATDIKKTGLDYILTFKNIFELNGLRSCEVEGSIIASVVPGLTSVIKNAVEDFTKAPCKTAGPGLKTGLQILMDNPAMIGTDLISNAVGAVNLYDTPAVVADFGTATVFSVINEKKQYTGSIICPGMGPSLRALSESASRLYDISLESPKELIGTNTEEAMQSGIIYGTAALCEGIIRRIYEKQAISTVIMTGVHAGKIMRFLDINAVTKACPPSAESRPYGSIKTEYDENLKLKGLKLIYEKNTKAVL